MSYTQLFFNSVKLDATTDTISLSPNFLCPKCAGRPSSKISTGTLSIPLNKELNINRLVTFKMPCCGAVISLYVAVHKSKGVNDLKVCIQRSDAEGAGGIPADWWTK